MMRNQSPRPEQTLGADLPSPNENAPLPKHGNAASRKIDRNCLSLAEPRGCRFVKN